jgi:adenylate cyclase
VRLFEVATGRHIWGSAFEGATTDAHVLQARVIEGICGTLPICLRGAEAARAERRPARDRTAHDLTMRAFRGTSALTQHANARALGDLDRALSIDPELCLAVALAAWCHAQRAIYNFAGSLEQERDEARRLAALALSLDDEDPRVLAVLGTASTLIGDLDLAELLIAKCLAIDPYCAMAWQRRGWIATYRSANTALADFSRSLALDPHGPDKLNSLLGISTAHFLAGRYDQAADWAVRGLQERPSAIWSYRVAAGAQARCGRTAEGRRDAAVLLRQYPDLTVTTVINALPMQAEFLARLAEGLESAGLPV